jgi:hypothetical protein
MTTDGNDAGRTSAPADDYENCSHDLAVIDQEYSGWHAWPAVLGGLVYARYPRSSPPLVVRAASAEALREAIEEAERERGLR